MSAHHDHLVALAEHLARQHEAIMDSWRCKVAADPRLTTGATLPRSQLNDHLPALLEDLENRLLAPERAAGTADVEDEQGDAAAHGLHRWQQGFDLTEVSRELGRFNECVVAALDHCAMANPQIPQAAMAQARSIWAALLSVAVGASTEEFFRLQQLEAAGQVIELERALEDSRQMEVRSAALWQQAAHDLRGNLGVVALATAGLASARAPAEATERLLGALDRNVHALHSLLEDVTSLARLQGGQERRTVAAMDASVLLREIAEWGQQAADERQLLLGFDGPDVLWVEGDAVKIRRIVQNLVLNAVKYTPRGSVQLDWGAQGEGDSGRWFIGITDTGPGLHPAQGGHLTQALNLATEQAREVGDAPDGPAVRPGEPPPSAAPHADGARAAPNEGEGIGLSIVKRLCALLDATLEVDSKPGQGTRFRILLPRRYATPPPAP